MLISWSLVCFIVLTLILYSHFYVTNFTNNLYSVDISDSVNTNLNGPSINIFDKGFSFTFYNSIRLLHEAKEYQKNNLFSPKGSNSCGNMNILSFLILASKLFLLVLLFLVSLIQKFTLKIIKIFFF